MGKAKANEPKKYTLTDKEFEYLKTLAEILSYNVGRDQLISGFLYFICTGRLGYPENQDLRFEVDLQADTHELIVTPVEPGTTTPQD